MIAECSLGLCKDCRHWLSPSKRDHPFELYDEGEQYGECSLIGKGGSMATPYASDMYGLRFLTLPNFGCIQFEAIVEQGSE